jgi:lysophospholipase L1-like esterase
MRANPILAALALAVAGIPNPASARPSLWVDAWAAAPDRVGPAMEPGTIRQVVRLSAGGTRVRIRLSNLLGKTPLTMGPVELARSAGGSKIAPAGRAVVTFGGNATVTIPKGKEVLSDPVAFATGPLEPVAVSLFLPSGSQSPTVHGVGLTTAFRAKGHGISASAFPTEGSTRGRVFLTDVEVEARAGTGTLVLLGDSITDGVGSTFDKDARWPDVLAARLQGDSKLAFIALANAGISGNRILNDGAAPFIGPSAIARFGRDVGRKPGVRWVLLFEGINDISAAGILNTRRDDVSAAQIIAGMKALVDRAHKRGIATFGATLLPTGGMGRPSETPAGEVKRQAVNHWIREGGGFDAVVDLDAALRDPLQPGRLRPEFDSGDHLHPNDRGHETIADAVYARLLSDLRGSGR